jgi:hypothetical protein
MNVFCPVTIKTVFNTVYRAYRNEFNVNTVFWYFHLVPVPVLAFGASMEYVRNEKYKIIVEAGLSIHVAKLRWYGIVEMSYC